MSCFYEALHYRCDTVLELFNSPFFKKMVKTYSLSRSGKRVLLISRRYKGIGKVLGKFLFRETFGEMTFLRGEKVVRLTWPDGKMPRFTIDGKVRSLGGLTKQELKNLDRFLSSKSLVTCYFI